MICKRDIGPWMPWASFSPFQNAYASRFDQFIILSLSGARGFSRFSVSFGSRRRRPHFRYPASCSLHLFVAAGALLTFFIALVVETGVSSTHNLSLGFENEA